MSATGKAVVAGATGMIGGRLVERLAGDGWQVVGLCRNPPADSGAVSYLALDLLDEEACRATLGPLHDVTHLFYCSRASHGEGGAESVADNLAMLRNAVEALAAGAAGLRHVHVVHGGKWYGQHLGPYKSPAKESDPRHMPPNFYYDQQDYIEARAGPWTWTTSRPCLVYDFVPGRPRNLISVLAAFAAISRELGLPLCFPGPRQAFDCLGECAAVPHVAKAIAWMASEERCANQAFNITNGDCFRWQALWPRLAEYFAMAPGPVRSLSLASTMADKAPVWQRVVERYRLEPTPYEKMALWAYGDFVFSPTYDILSDTTKIRRFGFHDCLDSEEMFFTMLDRYREARLIP